MNLQLDKAAAENASRVKRQQERNRQILYRIIDVVVLLAWTGHPVYEDIVKVVTLITKVYFLKLLVC